jgi:hypothetical protein
MEGYIAQLWFLAKIVGGTGAAECVLFLACFFISGARQRVTFATLASWNLMKVTLAAGVLVVALALDGVLWLMAQ